MRKLPKAIRTIQHRGVDKSQHLTSQWRPTLNSVCYASRPLAGAIEEGIPYQTLIASVLHKYVSGRLIEIPSRLTTRSTGRAKKLRAG